VNIGLIVEGHGDVAAVPVLIRKLANELAFYDELQLPRAFRLSRGQIVKKDELLRAVELMSRKVGADGAVFVIFDADDDCPVELAEKLVDWINEYRHDLTFAVVIANREFESWFIASAEGLRGIRGFANDALPAADSDLIRDAKGWLTARMVGRYSETLDQPSFAASLDWRLASRSRSFRKFLNEVARLLEVNIPDH
jgi:hypothetical protein